MKTVKYTGPSEAVVDSAGRVYKRGASVEVPDDVAKGLLSQDTFDEVHPADNKKLPAEKAAK